MEMATHPINCEKAQQHKCLCSKCGGLEHGWPYRIRLAYAPTSVERDVVRRRAEEKWLTESEGREKKATFPMKEAAVDTSISDLIDWLAETIHITDRVQALGHALTDDAMEILLGHLGAVDLQTFKKASVNHFWCELLASLACTLEAFGDWNDRLRERLSQVMVLSKCSDHIAEGAGKLAVQAALRAIPVAVPLPSTGQVEDLLWPTRILAILMCKAPERHEAVSKCCLDPIAGGADELVKAAVARTTKERLVQVLPPDWLPATRASLFK
ncbi:hypothetical protein AGRA3207_001295 [Actinomadura graeca]|uniref:Uncharacterized protein n=1 Tax=Actinomadura graeca TaxID=2750812 RepID=A0ABX8QT17_9ACTN|nr:hypothetical protein [Actinomadura graeca]QXJ20562.1 hypothetical protein AGRA3207_001295 [Actinomadura graeca]